MWLLQLIPDAWLAWAVNATLIVGAVSMVLGVFTGILPVLRSYSPALKIIGFILLLVGAYLNGGLGVELEYRERIAAMQEKINIAEGKSQQENVRIVEKIVTETKIIKQDTQETQYLIEQMKDKINLGCELSPEAITLYNESITGRIE